MAPSLVPDTWRQQTPGGEPAPAGSFLPWASSSWHGGAALACTAAAVMAVVAGSEPLNPDAAHRVAAAARPLASAAIPTVRLPGGWRGASVGPARRDPFAFAPAPSEPARSPVVESVAAPAPRVITPTQVVPRLIGFASDATPAGARHTAVLLTDDAHLWFVEKGGTWRSFTASEVTDAYVDLRNDDSGGVTRLVLK